MKKVKLVKAFLILAGLIGVVIGAALLFTPIAFEASAGIDLENNTNLLSEIRAPGAALLLGGCFIIAGAFHAQWRFISLVLTCLFYLSYGIGRLYSGLIDGIPGETLIFATIIELGIGCLGLYLFFSLKNWPQRFQNPVQDS